MLDPKQSRHVREPIEPIARLHTLLLSLFGSGDQFRRWIALGPHGQKLVVELPDHPQSTAAALLAGIELLMRRGHIDADFFVRLAEEFPRRVDDISRVSESLRPHTPAPSTAPPRRRGLLTAAAATVLLILILRHEGSPLHPSPQVTVAADGSANEQRVDRISAHDPPGVGPTLLDRQPTFIDFNDATVPRAVGSGPTRPDRQRPSIDLLGAKAPPARPATRTPDELGGAKVASATPRAAVCDIPPELAENLDGLARASISSAAVVERFTVVLRPHADDVDVSPRPLPGQTARSRIYDRLALLGPETLGRCVEIPIDITFSHRRATLSPRLP